MQVKDMVALTDIWRVIMDDPGTTMMTVTIDPLSASFVGTHCKATAGEPGKQERITVAGDRLRGVLALFDPEAELQVSYEGAKLAFKTQGRVAHLTTVPEGAGSTLGYQEGSPPILLPKQQQLPIAPLISALQFLQSCVGTQPNQPLLTGVKVNHDSNGAVLLAATDKESHTGLARVVGNKPTTKINSEVVMPTKELLEFLTFAKGLGATDVMCRFGSDKSAFSAAGAAMEIGCLTGANPFPQLSALPTVRSYPHAIQVDIGMIAYAVRASILLDADRAIRLVIRDGRAVLGVSGEETGAFRTFLPTEEVGQKEIANCDLMFDAHWLEPVEHLGTTAALYYKNPLTPALLVGENGYRLWMALINRS